MMGNHTAAAPTLTRPPTPFPVRAFVAIGAAWVLLDLPAVVALSWHSGIWYTQPSYLITAWVGSIAARIMLLLGWWFMGEGLFRYRLAGAALFAPVLIPTVIREPELLCGLAISALFAAPFAVYMGLAFVILRGLDYRLVRGLPVEQEKTGQFTVRQLMLLTFVAAVVSALLRWAQHSDLGPATFALIVPLLAWIYPFVACRGLLRPKWYPEALFAAGITAYVLALPSFLLPLDSALHPTLFIAAYTLIFTIHLLLLRQLNFRLIQVPRYLRPPKWLPPEWRTQ